MTKFRWKYFLIGFIGFQVVIFIPMFYVQGTWQNKLITFISGKK